MGNRAGTAQHAVSLAHPFLQAVLDALCFPSLSFRRLHLDGRPRLVQVHREQRRHARETAPAFVVGVAREGTTRAIDSTRRPSSSSMHACVMRLNAGVAVFTMKYYPDTRLLENV